MTRGKVLQDGHCLIHLPSTIGSNCHRDLSSRFPLAHLALPAPRNAAPSAPGEPSSAIRGRVEAARQIQRDRFRRSGAQSNAEMSSRQLRRWCELDPLSRRLIEQAIAHLGLSARAYDRVLKVARTIADLAG